MTYAVATQSKPPPSLPVGFPRVAVCAAVVLLCCAIALLLCCGVAVLHCCVVAVLVLQLLQWLYLCCGRGVAACCRNVAATLQHVVAMLQQRYSNAATQGFQD